MGFIARLRKCWQTNRSLLCVGLDPDPSKIPECLRSEKNAVFAFNKAIVDATADLVCAFKPQIAYYAAFGLESELEMTMQYIKQTYPNVLLLLDAKRADIGDTSKMYAREAFERFHADAVTVNPYLGFDAIEPFLSRPDKGAFVLCRTSNPGSSDLQQLESGGKKLYEVVADKAINVWNTNENVGLVVGANHPEELKSVRAMSPTMPFLVPGVGHQGGSASSVVANGLDARGEGLLINSSRAILYASNGKDFAEAARAAAEQLKDEIDRCRAAAAPS